MSFGIRSLFVTVNSDDVPSKKNSKAGFVISFQAVKSKFIIK
jgi:hypothetical protein